LKEGERVFEHNDTFKRLFSVDQSKSVQLPRNKYNNNLIKVHLEKYLLMKSNHINDLLERQKMYNDEYKEEDIARKPNHTSFKLLQ
jgi:hypothetical protein